MTTSLNFLSTIIAIPFIGVLFALTAKDDDKTRGRNAFNVSVLAVITNLLVLWRIAALLDISASGLQLTERYDWLENPKISISLGIDIFSLLLIVAVHAAVLIGMFGARHNKEDGKALMVFSLLFLCMITGFFTAADIFPCANKVSCPDSLSITCLAPYFCFLQPLSCTTIKLPILH